jgi:hypothetical protein
MKKALGILIVLALMAVSVPMFADAPTFTGEILWKGAYNATTTDAGAVRERVGLTIAADKYNSLWLGFRFEKIAAAAPTAGYLSNALYNVKVMSDIGGAAGLPFGLKLTAGYFDTYFTSWAYYDQSGYAFYNGMDAGWPNKLVNLGMQAAGTVQLDAAFGPVNVHFAEGLDAKNTLVGFDTSFAGIGLNVAYGAYNIGVPGDLAKGDLSIEASYGADLGGFKLNAAPYFRYGLGDSKFTTGLNIGADVSMLHAAVGVQGDSVATTFLHKIVVDAYVKPIDNLKAGLSAYLDLTATAAFQGVDVNASYAFGATSLVLGYAYCDASVSGISIWGDTTSANGVYLLVNYKF